MSNSNYWMKSYGVDLGGWLHDIIQQHDPDGEKYEGDLSVFADHLTEMTPDV